MKIQNLITVYKVNYLTIMKKTTNNNNNQNNKTDWHENRSTFVRLQLTVTLPTSKGDLLLNPTLMSQ